MGNNEMTAKEALRIISRICNENPSNCASCRIYKIIKDANCVSRFGDLSDEIIKICQEWKFEHETVKTEWVYMCRIIEDTGEGKECVHEVQIKTDSTTADYEQYKQEARKILEEYCRNHEGKFFAKIESLCVTKGN